METRTEIEKILVRIEEKLDNFLHRLEILEKKVYISNGQVSHSDRLNVLETKVIELQDTPKHYLSCPNTAAVSQLVSNAKWAVRIFWGAAGTFIIGLCYVIWELVKDKIV